MIENKERNIEIKFGTEDINILEKLQNIEKEFLLCGYNQETIDEIKGTGDIEEQYNNLEEEQSNWNLGGD